MAEYAPAAIQALYDTIARTFSSAQLSGIQGDAAHTYGYHRGRNYVDSGDYSAQQADDLAGSGEACSGLDVTLNDSDMVTITSRLISATETGDDRLLALRSFFGTVDNRTVTGKDVRTNRWVTSDDSHLWHVHLSLYRRWADDSPELQNIAHVITGGGKDDDMPSQLYLTASKDKPTAISEAGVWYTVGWDSWQPSGASSGLSAVLAPDASLFSCTADLYVDGLAPEENLYVRIQTLDRSGVQRALYPIAELRGTGGQSDLSYSRVGSVPDSTNLRVLVSATAPCQVAQAWWRVLYW